MQRDGDVVSKAKLIVIDDPQVSGRLCDFDKNESL